MLTHPHLTCYGSQRDTNQSFGTLLGPLSNLTNTKNFEVRCRHELPPSQASLFHAAVMHAGACTVKSRLPCPSDVQVKVWTWTEGPWK